MNNFTDAVRSAIPEMIKKPLRGVRSSSRRFLDRIQWVGRDCVRPVMKVLSYKIQFCVAYLANGCKAKTIVTFPHRPEPDAVLYKICHRLGFRITDVVGRRADLIVNWEDCTVRCRVEILEALNQKQPVLNLRCRDISKRKVEAVHQAVFGYGLEVNPRKFVGRCVKKSDDNATHDGRIIQCPVKDTDDRAVYQRVVNNSGDGQFVEDIRVPVFGSTIPFCYRKVRPIGHRFSNQNSSANVCEVSEVLSAGEVSLLVRFCHEMGLDYGEVDVLRDVDDKRIYIVDVNNTPFGPPNHLDRGGTALALERLSEAFVATWGLKA
jgi:hypothetical protein